MLFCYVDVCSMSSASQLHSQTDHLFDRLREMAQELLLPVSQQGAPGRVNRDLVRALGETGVLGLLFPEDAGERGQARARTICLMREAIGYVSAEVEAAAAMQGLGGYPVLQSGQPHQLERWLAPLRKGTAVAAFALTEPDAGSDAGSLQLEAKPDSEGWRLSGEKLWITNAPDADFYTTFARTTPGHRARGVTAFLVPGASPGLRAEPIELFAPHPIGRLIFDEVPVSREDVLGEVDHGFRVAMRTLDLFRPSVGAAAIGMAQAALDATVTRTVRREAFGEPLARKQAVAHALADASTGLAAARLLVADAADAYDRNDPELTPKAAMAKLFATETAQRVIDTAVQFHGASGLRSGHHIEELYREIRALRIYEGASEIQRDIIARHLVRNATASAD
jgi:acyl-CoA dehydrogenase